MLNSTHVVSVIAAAEDAVGAVVGQTSGAGSSRARDPRHGPAAPADGGLRQGLGACTHQGQEDIVRGREGAAAQRIREILRQVCSPTWGNGGLKRRLPGLSGELHRGKNGKQNATVRSEGFPVDREGATR